MKNFISIYGAQTHNLKKITLSLPRDKLIVFTGLSGSGKSSLAFDTIYAEGQRRYVESLSAYARQFLSLMQKPSVDRIDGLSPAISIEQKTTSSNPRSTVGTTTEIYDYMRLLWARIGKPYSPATGKPIESQTVDQIVAQILAMQEGLKVYLLAPFVQQKKGEFKKEFATLEKNGFLRIKVDGVFYVLDSEWPELNKNVKHDIDIVIDRLILDVSIRDRLTQSVEVATKWGNGVAILEPITSSTEQKSTQDRMFFSTKFSCPISGFTLSEIEPRLFSFNNPNGACPSCKGLGVQYQMDQEKIVPDETLSIWQGAVLPWGRSGPSHTHLARLEKLSRELDFSLHTPWKDLPSSIRNIIFLGSKNENIKLLFAKQKEGTTSSLKSFDGIIPQLERRLMETDSQNVREELQKYQSASICKACEGSRLKPEALMVKVDGHSINQITSLSIDESLEWFLKLKTTLSNTKKTEDIGTPILKEILERLGFLNNMGLPYLSLSRQTSTLSGGEAQRIRLASQIGAGLVGVLYVLDEPSIGLHQRDNERLLTSLLALRDLGNTVIVVEHDEDAIRSADYIVDIGPGAGVHGGHIIAEGGLKDILSSPESLTGQYLRGEKTISVARTERPKEKTVEIIGARGNNLKSIDLKIWLQNFVCFTGVSGSGKSSLVMETLYRAIARKLGLKVNTPLPFNELNGIESIDRIVKIDQKPIGRTPRSNPATYTGVFSLIREWFAALPESKANGYGPGRFSFNVAGGRCSACHGDGVVKIEMYFLADVYVECEVCNGRRYSSATLDVRYKNCSIFDVLSMTVDEGIQFFENFPLISHKLQLLERVGLGYIKLGQSATTLSGGEAQRIKLARELGKRSHKKTLYVLDEPTTGLHFHDIQNLLQVLHALVDQGHSVFVIEHNLDVIAQADWIIDLGPEGGSKGGEILCEGEPSAIAAVKQSYTGEFLRRKLNSNSSPKA